ncbi:MAG: diguanylate cyclase [Peptococcaceae bacterium]|nr:diguanylate cyclase [Peptococcaceae bacterium]
MSDDKRQLKGAGPKKESKVAKTMMTIVVVSMSVFLLFILFVIFQLYQAKGDSGVSLVIMVAGELVAGWLLLTLVLCVSVSRNLRPFQQELKDAVWKVEESSQELEERAQELEYLNLHDSLTGLHNRTYWDEMARRSAGVEEFGIALFVIDSLKLTNDALGYTVGEKVLATCAKCLRANVGKDGMVARISGAEFGVLYPWANEKYMASVYDRILKDLEEYNKSGAPVPIHISAGWAVAKGPDEYADVYAQAFAKMNQVRKMNHHFVSDSIFTVIVERLKFVDYVTGGHIDNLMALTREFFEIYADNVYIGKLALPRFEMLVRYHDIGKVGLREDIHGLSSFSLEDRLEMDRHVIIGYQVAMYIPHLASIADLILRHHEWWDGTGSSFPYNQEYIPIECRLFSIFDAFEAMTGPRPHRQAVSAEKAIAEINKYAGKQFDPTLARMFALMVRARN